MHRTSAGRFATHAMHQHRLMPQKRSSQLETGKNSSASIRFESLSYSTFIEGCYFTAQSGGGRDRADIPPIPT